MAQARRRRRAWRCRIRAARPINQYLAAEPDDDAAAHCAAPLGAGTRLFEGPALKLSR